MVNDTSSSELTEELDWMSGRDGGKKAMRIDFELYPLVSSY